MRSSFSLLILILSLGTAHAERYAVRDGDEVVGAPVMETSTTLTVMTAKGTVDLAREDVLSVVPEQVSRRIQVKAAKARAKAFKSIQRDAKKLLSAYGKAGSAEQAALEAELAAFPQAALVEPLGDALDDRRQPTRELAVRLLAVNETRPAAVDELLRAAMTSDRPALRAAAHTAAVVADAERVEAVYGAVATSRTKPERRVAAIDYLGQMKRRSSVPGLIGVLEYVRSEIRTAMATGAGTRQVPLNLGSSGAAATNVPVELPQIQLVEINTTLSIPTLRAISSRAVQALGSITGEDLGDDPGAWQGWWEREGQDAEPQ